MYSSILPIFSLVTLALAGGWDGGQHHRSAPRGDGQANWKLSQFDSFLPFGDSYTDENRAAYFSSHNASAPPPGTVLPESFQTSDGGRIWARYVIQYAGSKGRNGSWNPRMTLYDYAVSGSVCSNELTPRTFLPNFNFPSVREYELPAFGRDLIADNPQTGRPTFQPRLGPRNAVYSMWIGTNDLGVNAFFTDSEMPGTDIVDYLDCVYEVFDGLYAAGGRYFVVMNVAPLNLTPQYANATEGGVSTGNLTAISEKMRQYVALVNDGYEYRTPYEKLVAKRYPGAHFAVYNVHDLILDIHQQPQKYLNGSAPLSVTTAAGNNPSPDSFMWHDALHPSEQTDRIIAREFMNVLDGNSSYATYW